MNKDDILAIRKSAGMTQAKFAAELGCTLATLSRWENGKSTPSPVYLKQLRHLAWKYKKERENGTEAS